MGIICSAEEFFSFCPMMWEGQVLIPHGFGLKYAGLIHRVNVNRLTRNTHRDRLAATPLHRYVRCRVEKI